MPPSQPETIPTDAGTTLPSEPLPLCHIIAPSGMMGYGFDEDLIDRELALRAQTSLPTALILDSGSTDSGPSKLALGSMTAPRTSYKRDLTKLISLILKYKVPLIFSSAGGDGSDAHVDEMHDVIEEVMESVGRGRSIKVLRIYAEVSKAMVKSRLEAGRIEGCGSCVPALNPDDIEATPRIVAQMGCEPFLDAMFANPDFDVIIGGRAYDPSPFVAFAAAQTMNKSQQPISMLDSRILGGMFHMGKILECGGLCAYPKSESATATVFCDGTFIISPLNPRSKCTPQSVAAHTLYEKTRPDLLYGPGGCLDLTETVYHQMADGRSVHVNGAMLKPPSGNYTVKLEAARVSGYRTIFIGAFKDQILTSQLDSFVEQVRHYTKRQHAGIVDNWTFGMHRHSGGGQEAGREVFVVGEALAVTQELANSIASTARIACVHGPYPGQKATSGNFAMGIGGLLEVPMGPCSVFCIYHLMELDDGEEGARVDESDKGTEQHSKALFTFRSSTVGVNDPSLLPSEDTAAGGSQASESSKLGATNAKVPAATKETKHTIQTSANVTTSLKTLGDVASIVRSKNSGPFEITFDVLFDTEALFTLVRDSGLLSPDVISRIFGVSASDILYCGFFHQALAFKATIPRIRGGIRTASGGFMEDDVHGSQQYLPLVLLELPEELADKIRGLSTA